MAARPFLGVPHFSWVSPMYTGSIQVIQLLLVFLVLICLLLQGISAKRLEGRGNIIFPSPCQLQIGTCHLPLQGLNHMLLQLLTFDTPWKEFRVEGRNEALCALGKTGKTGLQIVRYFQEPILWAHFLYLLLSRKALKSFMVMSAPCD